MLSPSSLHIDRTHHSAVLAVTTEDVPNVGAATTTAAVHQAPVRMQAAGKRLKRK